MATLRVLLGKSAVQVDHRRADRFAETGRDRP